MNPLALHPHSHSQSINPICASFGSASVLRHQPSSQLPLHHIQVFVQIHTSMPMQHQLASLECNVYGSECWVSYGFLFYISPLNPTTVVVAFHRQEACTRCSLHGPLRGVGKSSSRHSGDDSTATSLWLPERRALLFFGASSQCFRSNVFDPMVRSKQTAQFIFSSELKSIKRQPTAFLTLKVPVFCLLPSYPPVVFPTPPTLRKYLGLWVQSEPLGASSKETWSKLEPAKSKMHRQGRRRDKQSTKIRMIWDGMNRRYSI